MKKTIELKRNRLEQKEINKKILLEKIAQTWENELVQAQLVNTQNTMARRTSGRAREIAKLVTRELIEEEWK